MNKKNLLGLLTALLLVGSCANKKSADDEIFSDVELQDVKDQDALSMDLDSAPQLNDSEPAAVVEEAPVAAVGGEALSLFTKSDHSLQVGPDLWNKKFNPKWLEGCSGKKGAGKYSCVLKNNAGEKAVVVVMLSGAGVAQKVFVDSKGAGYPKHWDKQLRSSGFRKNGRSLTSVKLESKAKIVYLKSKKAATLILEGQ